MHRSTLTRLRKAWELQSIYRNLHVHKQNSPLQRITNIERTAISTWYATLDYTFAETKHLMFNHIWKTYYSIDTIQSWKILLPKHTMQFAQSCTACLARSEMNCLDLRISMISSRRGQVENDVYLWIWLWLVCFSLELLLGKRNCCQFSV